jgi:hypothetical protein
MIYIMDASAMLAFLRDEAGADVIETYLLEPGSHSLAHSINLCEMFYDFVRAESEAQANKPLPTCWTSAWAKEATWIPPSGKKLASSKPFIGASRWPIAWRWLWRYVRVALWSHRIITSLIRLRHWAFVQSSSFDKRAGAVMDVKRDQCEIEIAVWSLFSLFREVTW